VSRRTSAAVRSVQLTGPIVVASIALWLTTGTLATVGPSADQLWIAFLLWRPLTLS